MTIRASVCATLLNPLMRAVVAFRVCQCLVDGRSFVRVVSVVGVHFRAVTNIIRVRKPANRVPANIIDISTISSLVGLILSFSAMIMSFLVRVVSVVVRRPWHNR